MEQLDLPEETIIELADVLRRFIGRMVERLDPPIELDQTSDITGHLNSCMGCNQFIEDQFRIAKHIIPTWEIPAVDYRICQSLTDAVAQVVDGNEYGTRAVPSLKGWTIIQFILNKLNMKFIENSYPFAFKKKYNKN